MMDNMMDGSFEMMFGEMMSGEMMSGMMIGMGLTGLLAFTMLILIVASLLKYLFFNNQFVNQEDRSDD